MKTVIKIRAALVMVFTLLLFIAGAQNPRKTEVKIKSTVECAMCKKNLESKLGKVKGVRRVNADYTTHDITVVYNSRRTSLDELKRAIADIGYDADEVPANNKMTKLLQHKQQ